MNPIEQRISRLERENRRLKGGLLVLAALMVSLFLMGQASRPSVIEASRFVVRGPSGQIVAELGAAEAEWEYGSGYLTVYYADGATKLAFLTRPDDTAQMMLFGPRNANGGAELLWTAP